MKGKGSYNEIAGQSVERLAALSDGVFAVAMTLLALDLRAPAMELIHSDQDLWNALAGMASRLLLFVVSFMTLGIFWVGQQTQLNHLKRSSRGLSWIHLGFLLAVCLTPFSTTLLAGFWHYRTAVFAYWLNILALGLLLYVSWVCAEGTGLVRENAPGHLANSIKRRIVVAQAWYAFAAALVFIDARLSVGLFAAVQLNYALAPRIPGMGASGSEAK